MFIVLLAETGRIPVDNPATHLELTMIHEAMLLEYSGRYLALMEWGASIKQLVLMALLANIFFPVGLAADTTPAALGWGCSALCGNCWRWPAPWWWLKPPTPSCACFACRTC